MQNAYQLLYKVCIPLPIHIAIYDKLNNYILFTFTLNKDKENNISECWKIFSFQIK